MPSFARQQITTPDKVSFYHCVNRCVRRTFLCGYDALTGNDYNHRKKWVEDRLALLIHVFFVEIGSYAIMCNHFHIVLKIRPDLAEKISDEEVIDRWWKIFPKKFKGIHLETPPEEIKKNWLSDSEWLEERRGRLSSISWFMRCLSEYIAKKSNKEDGITGRFWQGRFSSQALLSEGAVLAASAYVDLNPMRAKMVENVEDIRHTSLTERIKENRGDRFIASFKPSYDFFYEETPFLLIDESDYVDICKWYANQKESPPKSFERFGLSLNSKNNLDFVKKYRSVLGPPENLQWFAKKAGRRWVKGGKFLGSFFV